MTETEYSAEDLALFQRYAEEAEAGYDPVELKRRGRPRLGPAAFSVVVPIRVTPELAAALDARAVSQNQTRSEMARQLLERELIYA